MKSVKSKLADIGVAIGATIFLTMCVSIALYLLAGITWLTPFLFKPISQIQLYEVIGLITLYSILRKLLGEITW